MVQIIRVTDMVRSFSDIVGRVHYKGEVFDIQKGNNIVARLSPPKSKPTLAVKDLNNFFRTAPHLEKDDIEKFEKDIINSKKTQDIREVNKWG